MEPTRERDSQEHSENSVVNDIPQPGPSAGHLGLGEPAVGHVFSTATLDKLAELLEARMASRNVGPIDSHDMSDGEYSDGNNSGLDNSGLDNNNVPQAPLVPDLTVAQPLPAAVNAPTIANSSQDFAALFSAPAVSPEPVAGTSASPAQVVAGFDVDKLGLAWGACYMQNEVPGPDINPALASLLTAHVRDRPVDDELKKLMTKLLIPGNCPNLVVPLLNKELEEVFEHKGAKICERTLARITALACKAMAPILGVLNDLILKNDSLLPSNSAALSDALIVISSIVNIASHGRKQNLQHTVNEPLLRHICNMDTKVGDKYLFDFDVGEKLKQLRKAMQIGRPKKFRRPGQDRGRRGYDSRSYLRFRSRNNFRGSWREGGQYYASSGRGGGSQGSSKPFLAKGQRGRGRSQR